jgi:phytoene dehydrogenase-like protein
MTRFEGRFDAVVVGAGINGMAAAAQLAQAGWSVALVDQHERIGGFIAGEERTVPGYRHDTYSSWHPLFVTGPVYAELGADLHRHGLEYANADGPVTASVADDGALTIAHRDVEETVAGFAEPADRDAYRAAVARFGAHAAHIGGLLGSELRSPGVLGPLWGLARSGGRRELAAYAREVATSGRAWLRTHFRGPEVDRLLAPWLLHAGLAPDAASGGLMAPVFAAALHAAGLPVVVGGAGNFVTAWERLLAERGVTVHTGRRVEQVLLQDGAATGVAGDGWSITAGRAVLASVAPGALYGSLLPAGAVPPAVADEAARFRPGRAAMQVHVALSGPVPWREPALAAVPLVHLSDGSASTGIACAEAEAGLLPRHPTVVVGQQHLLDPSRVPVGAAALWLQLQEVPFAPVGDAAGELDVSGGWDGALAGGYAERVLDRIEAQAPGLRELVVGLDVITPADLASYNPNAVAGDPYGGSAELDQNFLWRPLATAPGHATPVPRLWHIGASTHPGPGLGGGSGHLVARRLLTPTPGERLRRAVAGRGSEPGR